MNGDDADDNDDDDNNNDDDDNDDDDDDDDDGDDDDEGRSRVGEDQISTLQLSLSLSRRTFSSNSPICILTNIQCW